MELLLEQSQLRYRMQTGTNKRTTLVYFLWKCGVLVVSMSDLSSEGRWFEPGLVGET